MSPQVGKQVSRFRDTGFDRNHPESEALHAHGFEKKPVQNQYAP